jgi:DNA replication factor GINS
MNLDELQSVRDRERQTDKPQQLRESFYEDVGSFVEQLRAERERAAERHGTYADEVMQLTDEIEAASQLVEDIHERRIGKVVKAASLEAAELSPEVDGLTREERDLFEQLVDDIEHHREDVLAVVEGKDTTDTGPSGNETETERASGDRSEVAAADVMGSDDASDEPTTDSPAGQRGQRGQDNGDSRAEHPDPEQMHPDATPGDVAENTGGTGESGRSDSGIDRSIGESGRSDSGTDRSIGESGRSDSGTDPGTSETGRSDGGTGPGTGRSGGQRRGETEDDRGNNSVGDGGANSTAGDRSAAGNSSEGRNGDTPTLGADIERERVLVTESVNTFVGSDDRDYDLAADDVVTLPSTNADILVERDAARRL